MSFKQNLKILTPPIALMMLITISSSIPMDAAHEGKWYADLEPNLQNLIHIPAFALLSYLWAQTQKKRSVGNIHFFSAFITILFGCIDELHQMFVPGRYASLVDILLNTTGAIIGIILFKTCERWSVNRELK